MVNILNLLASSFWFKCFTIKDIAIDDKCLLWKNCCYLFGIMVYSPQGINNNTLD